MTYLPPFDVIKKLIEISTVRGKPRVSVDYSDFISIIRSFLYNEKIDEEWYLGQYEDVAEALKDGSIQCATRHFVESGYFEGRLPFRLAVDEKWYLAQNPDVAESIRAGKVKSAQAHFQENGYREGRLPFASQKLP